MVKKDAAVGMGLIVALVMLSSSGTAIAQSGDICESCPMTVGDDAKEHFKVTDGGGNVHYACCIGCALKMLGTNDRLHIETFCDWYGPGNPVVVDISEHGNVTSVDPTTALLLMGGGCTGNRVAYNQTAADALLANGFSAHTLLIGQQALPANTNVTTFAKRALTFAATAEEEAPQSYLFPAVLGIVGVVVIAGAVIASKKLRS